MVLKEQGGLLFTKIKNFQIIKNRFRFNIFVEVDCRGVWPDEYAIHPPAFFVVGEL